MKIFMACQYENGTAKLMWDYATVLRGLGHQVTDIVVGPNEEGLGPPGSIDTTLADYDVAHFWTLSAMESFEDREITASCTIHHLPYGYEKLYFANLERFSPEVIHVFDPFTERQLGQAGLGPCVYTPQSFDTSSYKPLPFPDHFTVGALGTGLDSQKRFPIIKQACKAIGVDCKVVHSEPWKSPEEILEFYKGISLYAVASWNEAGPLPAQEALLYGRPVVSTRVGQMVRVIEPFMNGLFTNGTVEDTARAIESWKDALNMYSPETIHEHSRVLIMDVVTGARLLEAGVLDVTANS